MRGLKNAVLSGSAWNFGGNAGQMGLELIVSLLLARILGPKAFGLIAMAAVFVGVINTTGRFGLRPAIVQQKNLTESHCSSAFWLSITLGLTTSILVVASAPVAVTFYQDPTFFKLLPALASATAVASFNVVPRALLLRSLRFPAIAKIDFAVALASDTIALAIALSGGGIWSIVLRRILRWILDTPFLWGLAKWRPQFYVARAPIRDLLSFSLPRYGFNWLQFISRNFDVLLIGKFLGSTELGIYTRGQTFLMVPLKAITRPLVRVLFPSFSIVQSDPQYIKQLYLRFTGALGLVIFPLTLGLIPIAKPTVLTILGTSWLPLCPLIPIFALAGCFQGVARLHLTLYNSMGRTDLLLRFDAVGRSVFVGSVLIGLLGGTLVSVSVGFLVGTTINHLLHLWRASRLIDLTLNALARTVASTFTIALVTIGLVTVLSRLTLIQNLVPWQQILVLLSAESFIYIGLLLLIRPQPAQDLYGLVKHRLRR